MPVSGGNVLEDTNIGGSMDWFLDGLGTMLIGLAIGGAGGTVAGWRLTIRSQKRSQSQRAGKNSTQTQIGRDDNRGSQQ